MDQSLSLKLDRSAKIPLTDQIRLGIGSAITAGVLVPGARLPSWRDLAAQLGVARGTVRAAYERLQDAQMITSSRSSGSRVAERPSVGKKLETNSRGEPSLPDAYREFSAGTGMFQMGVPAGDCFPAKIFSRIRARAARAETTSFTYPDPRGELELRREIAAHLAISRSLECLPSQITITAGFTGALGLVLRAIKAEGRQAWVENPGFPLARRALQIAQLQTVGIPVDQDGIDVGQGILRAPDAAVALVTAGQQAPLGPTLSLTRRLSLLEWAANSDAWVIEDDYLGELQLKGRAAPALASLDRNGRTFHIGTFAKTVSPTLRLGFVVSPSAMADQVGETAACLSPAPGPAIQIAVAEFMRDGHYLRHLRRMKRIYAGRRESLDTSIKGLGFPTKMAGLAVMLELPDGTPDILIARECTAFGLAPSPLSAWYTSRENVRSGLLLGVTTVPGTRLATSCDRLGQIILKHTGVARAPRKPKKAVRKKSNF